MAQALRVVVPDRDVAGRMAMAAGHDVIPVSEQGLSDHSVSRIELRATGEVVSDVNLGVMTRREIELHPSRQVINAQSASYAMDILANISFISIP